MSNHGRRRKPLKKLNEAAKVRRAEKIAARATKTQVTQRKDIPHRVRMEIPGINSPIERELIRGKYNW